MVFPKVGVRFLGYLKGYWGKPLGREVLLSLRNGRLGYPNGGWGKIGKRKDQKFWVLKPFMFIWGSHLP